MHVFLRYCSGRLNKKGFATNRLAKPVIWSLFLFCFCAELLIQQVRGVLVLVLAHVHSLVVAVVVVVVAVAVAVAVAVVFVVFVAVAVAVAVVVVVVVPSDMT